MSTEKMTQVKALSVAIQTLSDIDNFDGEVVGKLRDILTGIEKKNAKRASKLDLTSSLSREVLKIIFSSASSVSCKGIRETLTDKSVTSQKLVPILKAFEEKQDIISEKVKGVTYYKGNPASAVFKLDEEGEEEVTE